MVQTVAIAFVQFHLSTISFSAYQLTANEYPGVYQIEPEELVGGGTGTRDLSDLSPVPHVSVTVA
ncbi:MAG: hypothetical protein HQP61_06905 [Peptococcaceae bacterium]|nr:hypothetical protein [Candidatus Syntrophopropionicum ammoniitolerans]